MFLNLLAEQEKAQNGWVTYVIMGVIVALIIGLFVWQTFSNKKKQKEAQEMVNSLKIGDKIKTIGGVCGYLVEVNDEENTITIETGCDNRKSFVKFDKNAIYQTGSASVTKAEEVKEEKAEEKTEEKTEEVK